MLLAMLACQYGAAVLLRMLTNDAAIVAFGADFLRIIAWNFIGAGLIFCCSGMFQAFGNTLPSLYSMATRLITFAVPALIIARQPHFRCATSGCSRSPASASGCLQPDSCASGHAEAPGTAGNRQRCPRPT
ncbi:MATE family efflux transporter [Hankyongella ginsenosidimutans]|uniref:MATE family efflux transporter n=1 Tax=Hankyongella ginsenosidimutans TaxID=1763828 RepID=UPI002482F7F0|nr:MATE family efflux transporter [Hankyongella ginsenosidimutans]